MEFRARQGRDPSTKSVDDDKLTLIRLREEVLTDLKVDLDLVPVDFTEWVFIYELLVFGMVSS